MRRRELLIAPVGECLLLLIAGLAGWAAHQPLIFASLGPTAYELIEMPHRRTSRPWSIVMGHATGVGAGFLSLWLTRAWQVAPVSGAGVPLARVECAILAAGLTVFVTLLLRASQPAATATALLIALGFLQQPRDAAVILLSVALMTLVGEPLRRLRLHPGILEKEDERAH